MRMCVCVQGGRCRGVGARGASAPPLFEYGGPCPPLFLHCKVYTGVGKGVFDTIISQVLLCCPDKNGC